VKEGAEGRKEEKKKEEGKEGMGGMGGCSRCRAIDDSSLLGCFPIQRSPLQADWLLALLPTTSLRRF
jgi:hypothetical protein